MADELVTLTSDQRLALQIVFDVFHERAEWPTVQYVDHVLDAQDLASAEIVASLPNEVAQFDRMPAANGSIALTVLGVSQCEGAERELDLFLRAVQWCAERERQFKPSPTENEQIELTSTEFADHVGDLTRNDLVQVLELLRKEWQLTIGSGGPNLDEPMWTVRLNEGIRPYRGVASLHDYLAIKDRVTAAQSPVARAPVYPVMREPLATPVDDQPYDLNALHPLVQESCAALFSGGHYRQGVLDAAIALRDLVRTKSGLSEPDDSTLMGKALGGKKPLIVVADLSTETGKNVQRGTAYLAQGIIARLRNPLVHEKVELDYLEAIEMLALISRVARDIDDAPDAEAVALSTADSVDAAGETPSSSSAPTAGRQ